MNKSKKKPLNTELYKAILTLQTMDECIKFFESLCTKSELRAMEQRFEVARLLDSGHIYNEILEITGASSATISRVNRSLQEDDEGYSVAFERLGNAEQTDEEEFQ